MSVIIGNLSDWTITDNFDGTKKLEKTWSNGAKVTINRALIHEQFKLIETLPDFDITKMNPYSVE